MAAVPVTTQQQHPWRAALRTALQAAVAIPAGLLLLVTVLDAVLDAPIAQYLPPAWGAWLAGASAFLAALSATLARIMAIPSVDAWLKKIGAASAPEADAGQRLAALGRNGSDS